jgi:hypothetical protein
MFRDHFARRAFPIALFATTILSTAVSGAGEPDKSDKSKDKNKKTCTNAFKSAEQLEHSAHLRQAKDLYLSCAKSTCGQPTRSQCNARYAQLEADIPTVVPLVTDEVGDPKVDVQVTMDGELLASRLDGRALPIDPGVHEFSFTADGAVISTQKIMVLQGQRNRPITVPLRPDKRNRRAALGAVAASGGDGAKSASIDGTMVVDRQSLEKTPSEKTDGEKPTREKANTERASVEVGSDDSTLDVRSKGGPGAAPYVLGAAGLVSLGSYGLFSMWGRKDNDALSQCAPNCDPASVDHIRKLYLVADISLGIGVAALGTGVVWLLASPSSKEKPPTQASYKFDVRPTPSGGYATVSGSF